MRWTCHKKLPCEAQRSNGRKIIALTAADESLKTRTTSEMCRRRSMARLARKQPWKFKVKLRQPNPEWRPLSKVYHLIGLPLPNQVRRGQPPSHQKINRIKKRRKRKLRVEVKTTTTKMEQSNWLKWRRPCRMTMARTLSLHHQAEERRGKFNSPASVQMRTGSRKRSTTWRKTCTRNNSTRITRSTKQR